MKKALTIILPLLAVVLLFFIATQFIVPTPDLSASFDPSENDKIVTYTVENKSFVTLLRADRQLQKKIDGEWVNVMFKDYDNVFGIKAFHSFSENIEAAEPLSAGEYRILIEFSTMSLSKKRFDISVEFTIP